MSAMENKEKNERSASRNLVELSATISIVICVIIFFINYFFKFEERMFKKFNIKKWKNKAPVYEPEEFDIKKNNKEQLIINMCNAELVHEFNILFGYVSIVLSVFMGYVWLFIIASLLAGLVDCVFIMIQRYNRPRAMKLLFRVNEKKMNYKVDIN